MILTQNGYSYLKDIYCCGFTQLQQVLCKKRFVAREIDKRNIRLNTRRRKGTFKDKDATTEESMNDTPKGLFPGHIKTSILQKGKILSFFIPRVL